MALPIFQRTVVTNSGNIIPNAEVVVTDEGTGLPIALFADRAGTVVLSNPFFTGSDALVRFYAAPGEYRVTASGSQGQATWRYVQIIDTQDITTIGDNFTDIETVADNIQAIIDAPQAATNAANSATSAANSATAASNSAADAATSAASVNAANIVHAPGTGLPNELDNLAVVKGGNTGALTVGTNDATSLTIKTNNTERMRIDSSGNLLVGTTSSPSGSGAVVSENGFFSSGVFVGASVRARMIYKSARFTSTTGSEYIELNVGNNFTGSLNVYADNAGSGGNRYKMRSYMVTGIQTTAFNLDLVSETNGLVDSLSPTFTITVPTAGVIRLTNTKSGQPALDYFIYFNGIG